jgi:endo-1,4-beta-xylanase
MHFSATSVPSGQARTLRSLATRRGILVGTAVEASHLEDPRNAEILAEEFSCIEPENQMKFGLIHPQRDSYDFEGPDRTVEFAEAHGMKARGHTLVWHNQQPDWIEDGTLQPTGLADALHSHIETVMARYKGRLFAWDVVNEAFEDDGSMRSTVWYDKPGIGFAHSGVRYIEQAFIWARDADPTARLLYNDYNAETVCAKSDAIYEMSADFKARNVPLDGIGLQMHLELPFSRPEVLASFKANLARFSELGLDIHITELDVRLNDGGDETLRSQAELYRKVFEIALSEERCNLIQFWGFTDRYSWVPGFFKGQGWPLLWDGDYQKKPCYHAVCDALDT